MKYFIKTYGCQMNEADSEKLEQVFQNYGYSLAKKEKDADIVLVNTCIVRQNAEDRAAWYITSLKGLKRVKPDLKIGLCGCLAVKPGTDIKKAFPHVDLFIPPNNSEKLAEYLNLTFDISHLSLSKQVQASSGFVSIMHGCDNFCSYCIVPYVRGREVSRPMDEVLKEIRELGERGIGKITLLGQNVNSYEYGLANLLRRISENQSSRTRISENQIIRARASDNQNIRVDFLTSHPRDMSDEIINAVTEINIVEKYFHLPIQAGDDEILKLMNRGYSVDYFRKLVEKIRSRIPDASITTDVIVGFPGETEEQFQNTLKVFDELDFNGVNMTAYSIRPQTAAAKLPHHLSEEVKQRRLAEINKLVKNKLARKKAGC